MEQEPMFGDSQSYGKHKTNKYTVVLTVLAVVLVLALCAMIYVWLNLDSSPDADEPTDYQGETHDETLLGNDQSGMLPEMAGLYAQNPDIVGWIRIDGTKLDLPVMFTPNDEEKYIRANFEGEYEFSGLPFIDKDCSMSPESINLIIYGHNLINDTAFGSLMYYDEKDYWQRHPTIYFSTLYEERTYEIIAAFYDRVYYKSENVFKFYQFIDPRDKAHFDDAISNYKKKSIYDTGVTAEYGDHLLTLVTCSYHEKNGRFVVVAKDITDRQ